MSSIIIRDEQLDGMIHEIRGQRVMLDTDLARVYGVPTFRFNEAIKRNRHRFPPDFMFQLTAEEAAALRSQIAILDTAGREELAPNSSQNAILKPGRGKHRKYRPYAFTEHGALQAANVLRSKRAVQMSVFVIRAFVKMRETFLSTRELAKKLQELENQLTGRLDQHDAAIVGILQQIMKIIQPPRVRVRPKPQIGFHSQDK
jgi:hypothetical protein